MQILKVIGLLMEYPDELLWENKRRRAGADSPRRADAHRFHLRSA